MNDFTFPKEDSCIICESLNLLSDIREEVKARPPEETPIETLIEWAERTKVLAEYEKSDNVSETAKFWIGTTKIYANIIATGAIQTQGILPREDIARLYLNPTEKTLCKAVLEVAEPTMIKNIPGTVKTLLENFEKYGLEDAPLFKPTMKESLQTKELMNRSTDPHPPWVDSPKKSAVENFADLLEKELLNSLPPEEIPPSRSTMNFGEDLAGPHLN